MTQRRTSPIEWLLLGLLLGMLIAASSGCSAFSGRRLSVRSITPLESDATQSVAGNGSGLPIDVVGFESGVVWEFDLGDDVYLDLGAHALSHTVIDGQRGGTGIGVGVMLRPRLDLGEYEPYLRLGAGLEWYEPRIEPQGTPWGFPLSLGVGTRYEILPGKIWFSVDVNAWHFSNGKALFGHGRGPNPGVNTDLGGAAFEFAF